MPGTLRTAITERGFEAARASDRRRALRASCRLVARVTHRWHKMLKFRTLAVRRYNLKPRRGNPGSGRAFAGSYAQAKVERRRLYAFSNEPLPIGENKPFVWSGRTRASAAASRGIRVFARSAQRASAAAVVRVRQLSRAGRGKRIDLLEEFQRVAPVERQELTPLSERRYDKELARTPDRTTVIRG